MMRDEVLEQLMDSVSLLEMVEEVLSSHGPGAITEALVRGMRITLQKVREGIFESCEWVAAVEEESDDELPSGMGADTAGDDTLSDAEDEAVIADFIAEERRAAEVARARAKEVPAAAPAAGETRSLGGRTLLESILRQEPSAAEVMQRRHQTNHFEKGAPGQSGRWGAPLSGDGSSKRRSGLHVEVSVERSGDAGFILDSIERILE